MSSTSVSILVPLAGPAPELPSTLETIERYLQATGFAFDIRVLDRRDGAVLRSLLVPILPDPSLQLKACSYDAARLLIAESKLRGGGFDLEAAYLANKYGFRIERLTIRAHTSKRAFGFWRGVVSALS